MSIVAAIGGGDMIMIIGQMFVILIFVLIFTSILKYKRNYDVKTYNLLKGEKDIKKIREIRDQRWTYKSKAAATWQILLKEFSNEEANNLKKFATNPSDMEHYYASLIDNAPKEKRDEIRKNRDYFLNRYGKKAKVFPDFEGNLKVAIKWIIFFFILAFAYNTIAKYLKVSEIIYVSYILLGMIILAIVMINTILWIVRALSSYWARDHI